MSGAARNVCSVLGGRLIPYILPSSCRKFAINSCAASQLPFKIKHGPFRWTRMIQLGYVWRRVSAREGRVGPCAQQFGAKIRAPAEDPSFVENRAVTSPLCSSLLLRLVIGATTATSTSSSPHRPCTYDNCGRNSANNRPPPTNCTPPSYHDFSFHLDTH